MNPHLTKRLSAGRIAAALLLLVMAGLYPGPSSAAGREEAAKRYQASLDAERSGAELLRDKKYDEAIAKFQEADKLVPDQPAILYNLACAFSLAGQKDKALEALERAVKLGYADHTQMQADPDLEAMRSAERFKSFVELAKKNGSSLLYVPKDYKEDGKEAFPLFVILHGAGDTNANLFNGFKQILGLDRYFILAPHGSVPAGAGYHWNSSDGAGIAAQIDELKKKYRIGKVYLFGFSAGAHMSYHLVCKYRDRFEAFIPMAGGLRPGLTDEELDRAKGLPVYAIQGTADRVVPPAGAERSLAVLKEHGAITTMFKHPGAHQPPKDFRKAVLDAIKWIDEQKPAPEKAEQ